MTAYYNEIDPYAAQWLRNLIAAGHIAAGEVDERSIVDVDADDLRGFAQCHFFAGIGGWSYALRLAGWDDSRPVWTGSCPCQPFSAAGKGLGEKDPRHLWPEFHRLIAECRPAVVFGEQVASAAGRDWLTGVRADLEGLAYAVGAVDLCAASAGAPHIRQRLWWVGYADGAGRQARDAIAQRAEARPGKPSEPSAYGHWMANPKRAERGALNPSRNDEWCDGIPQRQEGTDRAGGGFSNGRLGDAPSAGLQGQWREHFAGGEGDSRLVGFAMQARLPGWNGSTVGLQCSDRPRRASAEPSAFPLAHGVSNRVGRLRAYGNAIVPQVAAEFIGAVMEAAA